jgi:hypothetical protein
MNNAEPEAAPRCLTLEKGSIGKETSEHSHFF